MPADSNRVLSLICSDYYNKLWYYSNYHDDQFDYISLEFWVTNIMETTSNVHMVRGIILLSNSKCFLMISAGFDVPSLAIKNNALFQKSKHLYFIFSSFSDAMLIGEWNYSVHIQETYFILYCCFIALLFLISVLSDHRFFIYSDK